MAVQESDMRLAILWNPNEERPPSGEMALRKFIKAGRKQGVEVELIRKRDYEKLKDFDALFIRETTRQDNHTYRFSKKAKKLGLVVMDDPLSICKCSDKIYQCMLMGTNGIPHPKSKAIRQGDIVMEFPAIIKIPNGSFSRGVLKAESEKELDRITDKLFRIHDRLLAQEYVPSTFDWRIGVLDNKPLFSVKYLMAPNHWQVIRYESGGKYEEGGFECVPLDDAPEEVVCLALRIAALIGDGLYGVDLKETRNGPIVIEINDNPNIDVGVEDKLLGDALYDTIIAEFAKRVAANDRISHSNWRKAGYL